MERSLNLRDEIGRFFWIAVDLWADFRSLPEPDAATTARRWLAPFLTQALGLRGLVPRKAPIELDGRRFPITHEAAGGAVPLVLAAPAEGLDLPAARFGDATRRRRALDLVQELLNAADDRLFGIVSDGRVLRILRNNPDFTLPAWIEIDLERVLEDRIFSDFAAFWMLAHGSRLEPRESGNPAGCILERWRHTALQTGERARGELRKGVAQALPTASHGLRPASTSAPPAACAKRPRAGAGKAPRKQRRRSAPRDRSWRPDPRTAFRGRKTPSDLSLRSLGIFRADLAATDPASH